MDYKNFKPYGDTVHITPSTTSQRESLADISASYVAAEDVLVTNDTDKTVYVNTGGVDVVAKKITGNLSSTPIRSGAQIVLNLSGARWVAVICDTAVNSGTVSFAQGKGA